MHCLFLRSYVFSYTSKPFSEEFLNRVVIYYRNMKRSINDIKRWNNHRQTVIFRGLSRLMFLTSLFAGFIWFIGLIGGVARGEWSDIFYKLGLVLQLLGTLSVLPELLRQQDNDFLKSVIQSISEKFDDKINMKEVFNGKIMLMLEQDGLFGLINLICQILFVLIFVFRLMPSTIIQSQFNPFIVTQLIIYFLIILFWEFFSLAYWLSKVYNHTLQEWMIASNFFLNLSLIAGSVSFFLFVTLIAWMIIKSLKWFSKFPIKKVFIFITFPAVFLGSAFQLLAAFIK